MAGGTHSQGVFSKLLIEPAGSPHTFDASSQAIEFLKETIRKQGRVIGGHGIRGTLARCDVRARQAAAYYKGEIRMYLDPASFDLLLANVMGMSETADVFTLTDTLPYFGILIDRDHGVFEYQDCMLDYWMIRARAPRFGERAEPDMVVLTLGVMCCGEIAPTDASPTPWPSPEPTLTKAAVDAPYVFQDARESGTSTVTINGSTREVEEFVLIVRNFVTAKYTNSLTPHSLRPTNRVVQCSFRVPWNSQNESVYGQAQAGAAAQFKLVNGAYSTTLALTNFKVPDNSPIVPGKDQVSLVVQGESFAQGSANELVITNDITA